MPRPQQSFIKKLIDYLIDNRGVQMMIENGQIPLMFGDGGQQVLTFQQLSSTEEIRDALRILSRDQSFRRDGRFPQNSNIRSYRGQLVTLDIFELANNDSIRVYITHLDQHTSCQEEADLFKKSLVKKQEQHALDPGPVDETRDLTSRERLIVVKLIERILAEPIETVIVDKDDVDRPPFLRGLTFTQRRLLIAASPEGDHELLEILKALGPSS